MLSTQYMQLYFFPCFCYMCYKERAAEWTSAMLHVCRYVHTQAQAGLSFHASCTSLLWSRAPLLLWWSLWSTVIHIYIFILQPKLYKVRYNLFHRKWDKWLKEIYMLLCGNCFACGKLSLLVNSSETRLYKKHKMHLKFQPLITGHHLILRDT